MLSAPGNGEVFASVSADGLQAKYTCNFGYNLIGSASRDCLADGSWGGAAPVCDRTLCPSLTDPISGVVIVTTRVVGGLALYECNANHQLIGSGRRTCQIDGSWSSSQPTCERKQSKQLNSS